MKRLVETVVVPEKVIPAQVTKTIEEIPGEGLEAFFGKRVILLCANYFYAGLLTGINDTFVQLKDAALVYETGKWSDSKYADAQPLPGEFWYVQRAAIEAFGLGR